MIEIEKGVPLPVRGYGRWVRVFDAMVPGDSFFVPGVNAGSWRVAATRSQRRPAEKYLVRTVEGGVRVWRIA